jgi:hypothetical protein
VRTPLLLERRQETRPVHSRVVCDSRGKGRGSEGQGEGGLRLY